jgi:redox-sensing transcriptional repressor
METGKQKVGSLPTIRRLPSYLYILRQLKETGRDVVSSSHIAQQLKLDAIQVRKDLAVTGIEGKPKIGYHVPSLISAIEQYLGWDTNKEAFLVGAGNLGSALLGYTGFEQHGIRVIAAFDVDPDKQSKLIHGKEVFPLEKLPDLVRRMHIRMGIITVPAEAAQHVANIMIGAGIDAIWNFSPVSLEVPNDVVVQNEDLSSGLAVLSIKSSKLPDL